MARRWEQVPESREALNVDSVGEEVVELLPGAVDVGAARLDEALLFHGEDLPLLGRAHRQV